MMTAYAIYNRKHGVLVLQTIAGNRKAAWDKFCRPEDQGFWKARHFYCVPVEIKVGKMPSFENAHQKKR